MWKCLCFRIELVSMYPRSRQSKPSIRHHGYHDSLLNFHGHVDLLATSTSILWNGEADNISCVPYLTWRCNSGCISQVVSTHLCAIALYRRSTTQANTWCWDQQYCDCLYFVVQLEKHPFAFHELAKMIITLNACIWRVIAALYKPVAQIPLKLQGYGLMKPMPLKPRNASNQK